MESRTEETVDDRVTAFRSSSTNVRTEALRKLLHEIEGLCMVTAQENIWEPADTG